MLAMFRKMKYLRFRTAILRIKIYRTIAIIKKKIYFCVAKNVL